MLTLVVLLRSQVIVNVKSYPTRTDLVLITNKPDNLARWRDSCLAVDGLAFEVRGEFRTNKIGWRHIQRVRRQLSSLH